MSGTRIAVLGPLEVHVNGHPIEVRRGIPRSLLAALVMRAREVVSTAALAELVWADDQPRNPVNALQIQVSYLRKRLGGGSGGQPLVTRPGGYALMVDDDDVDARRFERLVRDAAGTAMRDPASALDRYEEALGLWRGEAYADVLGEPFAVGEATRLEELRLAAIESRNEVQLVLGRHGELVGELSGLVNEHPLRERLHGQLMLALYRSGRQADALRAFERARSTLADQIGVDPGPELRRLERQILDQDPALEWRPPDVDTPVAVDSEGAGAPGPPSPPPPPPPWSATMRPVAPLPIPTSPLVGREVEIVRVRQLLERSRIVTLTGPAGAGKSRLALEVADAAVVGDDRTVWYVDLDPVEDPDQVAPTVAATLAIPIGPDDDAAHAVAASLASRRGLLVLDTCEHVVAGAAALVGQVLRHDRDVRVLATSRRPLGVSGEIAWPVPPLAPAPADVTTIVDALNYPAVALFVERATAARSDFELTDADLADVAAICLALDGLPLAIELAAARADVLSVATIRARLEHRFDLLVDGARDVTARQQTLRAAIDWSVELLSDEHRRFFARLAVFPGTFDLDAAAAIAAEPADDPLVVLADLVRQSMVSSPAPDRFRLLDTLRAYAGELLADLDADATSRRHAEHYLEVAERAELGIRGQDQRRWFERLRDAAPHLRAALEWFLSTGDGERAARLAGALGWFWTVDGMLADADHHLRLVLDGHGLDTLTRAKATWVLALVAGSLGDLERCAELGRAAEQLGVEAGDDATIGYGLNARAVASWALGDLETSGALHDRAIDHFTRAGDPWGLGVCTVLRARTAIDGDDPSAAERARQGLDTARAAGDAHLVGMAYEQLARLALREGDAAGAAELADRSLAAHESIGYGEGMLASLHLLGRASLAMGDHGAASAHHVQALRLAVTIGHVAATLEALDGLAAAASSAGDEALAARVAATVEAERTSRRLPRRPDERAAFDALPLGVGARRPAVTTDLAVLTEEILREHGGPGG